MSAIGAESPSSINGADLIKKGDGAGSPVSFVGSALVVGLGDFD
jgi:hypothetical protein